MALLPYQRPEPATIFPGLQSLLDGSLFAGLRPIVLQWGGPSVSWQPTVPAAAGAAAVAAPNHAREEHRRHPEGRRHRSRSRQTRHHADVSQTSPFPLRALPISTDACSAFAAALSPQDMTSASGQEVVDLRRQRLELQQQLEKETASRVKAEAAAKALQEERDALVFQQRLSEASSAAKDQYVANIQRQLTTTKQQLAQAQTYNRTGSLCDFIIEFYFMDKWNDFSNEAASAACSAWLDSEMTVEVVSGGQAYMLDFTRMVQINKRTGKEREIRIRPSLPQYWTMTEETVLDNLEIGAPFPRDEWDDVAHDWTESYGATFRELLWATIRHKFSWQGVPTCCDRFRDSLRVKKVWHIENPILLQEYVSTARRIAAERRGSPINALNTMDVNEKVKQLQRDLALGAVPPEAQERFLFHGTPYNNINSIVLEGLDSRCADRATYGFGTYFASEACKCWQYCCPKRKGQRSGYIVVARVALGNPFWVHYVAAKKDALKKPPWGFDSVLAPPGPMPGHPRGGEFQHHCEYTVFDRTQMYPEFVLEVEGFAG